MNISNEKKAEVVRTIIENVEVSAEADTHVQNMSAAANAMVAHLLLLWKLLMLAVKLQVPVLLPMLA